ncbi:MAG: bifunctional acetate--CoA ligase family protein/GNAT family N-acetyltransferase [Anderseniella sp.]|nr:bifunctional acetate--CoA ligase family protein/GNAT family N-acetyltransferase [Anderseniella sp.]
MGPHHLDGLFNPTSVAVFGASGSATSVGGLVYANLVQSEFRGPVYAINPKYKRVLERRCYARIADVKEQVGVAIIASPAATVPGILHECGEKGIRNAVILSAGFGEAGEQGLKAQQEVLDVARRNSIRFIGPNCVGLARPWLGFNASFLGSGIPKGNIALVSQSGALCSAIADWAGPHDLGLSALVSIGNAVDIGFGEALSFLSGDPETEAILLYVEGISQARSFISELRAAARLKPVIVLKAGRHGKSSSAARTHTGALMGSNAAFEAALERAGAVQAHTFGQLFAAAEILSAHHRTSGNRLAIVTNGGGAGVLASDQAEELRIDLCKPGDKTLDRLDAVLPPYWSRSNPLDILGDATAEAYREAIEACLDDSTFDGLLVMLTPQAMTDPEAVARTMVEAVAGNRSKPVLACWMGEASVAGARRILSSSGIPDFRVPEKAVEAFSSLARHELNQRLALETPGPQLFSDDHDVAGARMIIDAALLDDRTMLSETESKAVMKAFGIPVNISIAADSAADAVVAAGTIGFPVVMKIDSPQISHKSDVGGVWTNLLSAADVRDAFVTMTRRAAELRPDATINGVTLERMVSADHVRELLVGVDRDPVFGPVIVFGAGGTMVEILQDSAVALPPLTSVLAGRLINRTRVSRLLDAFRSQPAADRQAIVEVLLRISDLVTELPQVMSLDINPLFASPDGAIAVDARITVERAVAGTEPDNHLAVAPYPRHLVEHGFLPDGTSITIRPIRPEDAQSEQAFVRKLSPRARQSRFMQAIHELTPRMLAEFTQIDYSREMALVAVVGKGSGATQVGVARYVMNPDGKSCEFAIVVSDEIQKQGIGSRLMNALIRSARQHGLGLMEGMVLAGNQPMLTLMDELGFSQRPSEDDPETVVVERSL